jgi:hypothetical protein
MFFRPGLAHNGQPTLRHVNGSPALEKEHTEQWKWLKIQGVFIS